MRASSPGFAPDRRVCWDRATLESGTVEIRSTPARIASGRVLFGVDRTPVAHCKFVIRPSRVQMNRGLLIEACSGPSEVLIVKTDDRGAFGSSELSPGAT